MAPDGAHWFVVSKPLRAPFRDGSSVLARDLVAGLDRGYRLTYFGDSQRPLRSNGAVIDAPAMGYAPGLVDRARILRSLVSPACRELPLHLFFTPNRLSSGVIALLSAGRRKVVQTLSASDGAERFADLLKRLDRIVVHSDYGRERLLGAGLDPAKVVRIHPGVAEAKPVEDPAANQRLLYVGDLSSNVVERLGVVAASLAPGWKLTVAARPKTNRQRDLAAHLAGIRQSVEVLGEVSSMDALFRRSSVLLFMADHLRRKVDLPLALLEGCARGLPLLVTDTAAPLGELFAEAAGRELAIGRRIPLHELGEAVQAVAESPADLARWGQDARTLVQAAFSRRRMLDDYANLYASL